MKALPHEVLELIKSMLNTKFTDEPDRVVYEGKDLAGTAPCDSSPTLTDTEDTVSVVTRKDNVRL